MRSKTACFVLVSSILNAACVESLPAPPPPTQEALPQRVRLLPNAPGKGRVVIDVTNGPARVVEVVAHGTSVVQGRHRSYVSEGEITKPICVTTPCAANFDFGEHELRFISQTDEVSWGEGTVNVDGNDALFVHTMGRDDHGGGLHHTGDAIAGLGFLGALVGTGLIIGGAISNAASTDGTVWRRAQDGDWKQALLLLPASAVQGVPRVTSVTAFTEPLSDAIYLSTDGYAVLISTDGGDDWIRAGAGIPDAVSSLSADSARHAVYAGTSDGLWEHVLQQLPAPPAYQDAALVWRWLGIGAATLIASAAALLGMTRLVPRRIPD